jgi:hypothetical protein
MLDPVTGADHPLTVPFDDSLDAEPILVRPRPYAYIVPPRTATSRAGSR